MRVPLFLAGLSGLIGVAMGAFAAHGVSDEAAAGWLRTGGQYQLLHSLAVFAGFSLDPHARGRAARTAAWLFLAGVLLFSGSLYLMAFTGIRALGMVTPMGGVLLMAGWAALAWAGWRMGERPGT